MTEAMRGWDSDFKKFSTASPADIVKQLAAFIPDASQQQSRAWRDSIPTMQREVAEVVAVDGPSAKYTAVLEYQLPLEFRRTDAVFLMHEAVVVIELKGKGRATQADLDQAQAYARDLRAYHSVCEHRPVHAVLVPTLASHETGTGPRNADTTIGRKRCPRPAGSVACDEPGTGRRWSTRFSPWALCLR